MSIPVSKPGTPTPETPRKSGRPKGPVKAMYHVLKAREDGLFQHLTNQEAIEARSRKQVVEELGATMDGSETFIIVPEKVFSLSTPRTETKTKTIEVTTRKIVFV